MFKGSDFSVCLYVVLEAEKWNLTDQDLRKICGQNLIPGI